MDKRKIECYISDELSLDDQKIALDFVDYLKNNEMEFVKDNGYWKDKIYYIIKYNNILYQQDSNSSPANVAHGCASFSAYVTELLITDTMSHKPLRLGFIADLLS